MRCISALVGAGLGVRCTAAHEGALLTGGSAFGSKRICSTMPPEVYVRLEVWEDPVGPAGRMELAEPEVLVHAVRKPGCVNLWGEVSGVGVRWRCSGALVGGSRAYIVGST